MSSYVWPSDDGWPYPDTTREVVDLGADLDEDLIWLRMRPHLLDGLDPLERQVIAARFGLGGQPVRSMKQLLAAWPDSSGGCLASGPRTRRRAHRVTEPGGRRPPGPRAAVRSGPCRWR